MRLLLHQPLFFPLSKGINTVIINPLLVSNFARLSFRKTKTDKKDSQTIARFLLSHRDSIAQYSIPHDIRDLRDVAREREALCHLIASTKNEINRTSKPEVVREALQRSHRGRKVSLSVEDIIKAPKDSLASYSLAKELILPQKISTLLHLMEQLDRITDILSDL